MKKLYPTLLAFIILAFILAPATLTAQCTVTAPGDTTINCGSSATLAATTTAVNYNLVQSACAPIPIVGTNAFPTACDDCVTGQIPIGFNFNFYGNVYNTAVIQSNGIVGFGNFTFTGFSAFAIPPEEIPITISQVFLRTSTFALVAASPIKPLAWLQTGSS